MGYDWGFGEFFLDFEDAISGEFHMDVAGSLPQVHGAAGLFHDPGAEIGIGHEQDISIGRNVFHDAHGIAAGADDIAEGLDMAAAVDVGDHIIVLVTVFLEECFQFRAGTAFFERAAGVFVGQDDDFFGIHDFGRFGHKMHAAEGNDIGIGFFRLIGESQRVTHVVSHVLNGFNLVIMSEDNGVTFFFKAQNIGDEVDAFESGGHGEME